MNQLKPKPQPLYKKVKNHILTSIAQGRLKPDSRIPSENELVQELNVSRMTVNRALRELTAEGLLIRIQGVGSFVAPQKPQSTLLEIISIAEEIRRRGGVHSSTVHLLQSEQATGIVAKQMQLAPGAQIYHALLAHHEDGIPVQLADRYVNPTMAPDFLKQDFNRVTPADYLLRTTEVTEVEHIIEAVSSDRKTAELLKLEENTPCLVMHRTTWSGEVVVTLSRFIYPGPRYRLGGRFKPINSTYCSVL